MAQPLAAEQMRDAVRCFVQLLVTDRLSRFGNDDRWLVGVGLGMDARVH